MNFSSQGYHLFPFLFPLKINENNQEKNTYCTMNKHATSSRKIISYSYLSQSALFQFHFMTKYLTVPLNPFDNFLL